MDKHQEFRLIRDNTKHQFTRDNFKKLFPYLSSIQLDIVCDSESRHLLADYSPVESNLENIFKNSPTIKVIVCPTMVYFRDEFLKFLENKCKSEKK